MFSSKICSGPIMGSWTGMSLLTQLTKGLSVSPQRRNSSLVLSAVKNLKGQRQPEFVTNVDAFYNLKETKCQF